MRVIPRILYFACFVGLAMVGVLAFNHIVEPSMLSVLTRAVLLAAVAAAPGLIYRRLWPLTLVLLPVACYLLLRTVTPLPETVHGISGQYQFYAEQLHRGALLYVTALFPRISLLDSPELRLFFAFVIFWVIGAAAFVCVGLRKPLPAIALILILFGFSLTVDSSVRSVVPTLLFLVLATCLFVLSRGVSRPGWKLRNAVVGALLGTVGAGVALLVLTAAPSAAAAPWWNWQNWTLGANGSVYTFNWLQNYPQLLNPGHNVPVMQVRSPYPSYWRANALDTFTGTGWTTSQAFLFRIPAELVNGRNVYDIPRDDLTVPGHLVTEEFSMLSASTSILFVGGDPRTLATDSDVAPRMNEMRALRVSSDLGPATHYTLTATIPSLNPQALVGLGRNYPEDTAAYLTLPFPRLADLEGPDKQATWKNVVPDSLADGSEWLDLYSLNQRIVGSATDPYQIALQIEEYLRTNYLYSLTPPKSSRYTSAYAAFLFDTKSGYCQHFAGAMALLLRFNSIPSRVAVGFATGQERSPGVYLVSSNNAHSWVEVYFPTVGWVAFDPTPGRSLPNPGGSSTSPGFVNPFQNSTPSSNGATNTTVTTLPRQNQNTPTTNPQPRGGGYPTWAIWLAWVLGMIVVLSGWPFIRGLWRRRSLHRGSWDRQFQASLTLLRRDMQLYGAPVSAARTLEEVLSSVGAKLGLEPDVAFIDRADAVLFGGRKARSGDFEQAEALRHAVNARFRKQRGWLRSGLAWYGLTKSDR